MVGKGLQHLAVDAAGTTTGEPAIRHRADAAAMLIHQSSLSETVDAVNEAVFCGKAMPAKDRRHVARWIAARQGLPGAYGELFAGFAPELASGIRLFTGERVTSASARHILGEESCRALLLLKSEDAMATAALTRATAWIIERVEIAARDSPRNSLGAYCCGKCTVGLWRNILAGGLDRQGQRLRLGLSKLRAMRDGQGGWRAFPFWYTVLALAEMDRARRAASCGMPRRASAQRQSGPLARARLPYAGMRSPAPPLNDSDARLTMTGKDRGYLATC